MDAGVVLAQAACLGQAYITPNIAKI